MRFIKTFGFVVAAALMAMAAGGAASASATAICETEPLVVETESGTALQCPEGFLYGVDIEESDLLSGTLASDSPQEEGEGEIVFETPIGITQCTESAFTAELESSGVPPAEGGVTSLTFGNCTTELEPGCTVESLISPAPIVSEVEYKGPGGAGPNGSMVLQSPETSIELSCFSGILEPTCTYEGASEVEGDLYNLGNENAPTGDEGGVLDLTDTFLLSGAEGSGSEFCPSEGVLSATYTVAATASATSLAYVAQGSYPTKLCEAVPTTGKFVLECPAGKIYKNQEVIGTSVATTKLTSTAGPTGTVECKKSQYKGSFQENGSGSTSEFKFEGEKANEPCTSTLNGTPKVSLSLDPQLYTNSFIVYNGIVNPNGRMWLTNDAKGKGHLVAVIEEAVKVTCKYPVYGDPRKIAPTTSIQNGSGMANTVWTLNRPVVLSVEDPAKSGKCPTKATFTSQLALTGQGGVKIYVAFK